MKKSFPISVVIAVIAIILAKVISTYALKQSRSDESFKGIVTKKYIGEHQRGNAYIIIDDKKDFLLPENAYFDKIDSGDFILKNKGELKYTIIKGNGDTIILSPQY